ncbi:hypothetical protein D3227_06370 [Mesorhizobium waimense]|uniref:Uncharacterized protein n=1 Tax=Mesorhizobium waimense TaxID=1300307 RepID=A0A3A5LAU6_9HYPH|nr:hypothetical protein [Mesorhizobium waimense]RJT41409.1 hypothetical protein D3227_06370 [Mesorhizobium waimense]
MAPAPENFRDRLDRVTTLLHLEDERGLVLAASAFAEDLLGRLIRAFLVDVKASGELLDGFTLHWEHYHPASRPHMRWAC